MEPVKLLGRLFSVSAIDPKDELEERFEKCVQAVNDLTKGLADKDAHDALMSVACKDARAYEEISWGLVYLVLTDPLSATKCYRDLALITRDGFQLVITVLNQIAFEKYLKLTDTARVQLMWLVREIVRAGGAAFERLLLNLMRNIAGGDVTPKNLWLADQMLDVFVEQRAWLEKNAFMTGSVVYTYLRLMEDHMNPNLHSLLRKEAAFVSTLLRERFVDCMPIGRDLIRALQNVARLQDFEGIWKDLLWNPKALSPNLTGIAQLLSVRTSRSFLTSRVTPDMERKISFLTSSVKFGNHKRYQDWFQRQYLSTPESQTLRCDLIRFIVGVIHPPNEVLSSDVMPRWAVIGWLLTTCTVSVITANCKLALFYDWFFYDIEKDNIMNIEPAILLMLNSMKCHPQTTVSLLDFLCRIVPSFYPRLDDRVQQGVHTSLRQILKKGVLPSLTPIVDNHKMDRELRNLAIEMFPEFLTSADGEVHRLEDMGGPVRTDFGSPTPGDTLSDVMDTNQGSAVADEPVFSEDEESSDESSIPPISNAVIEVKEKPRGSPVPKIPTITSAPLPALNRTLISIVDKIDLDASVDALEGSLRSCVEKLRNEEEDEIKCEIMEELVQLVVKDDLDSDDRSALAQCLAVILSPQMECKIYPEVPTPESLEESTSSAFHVLFRALCEMTDDDPGREPLLDFLASLDKVQPRVAYHLLYFLRASRSAEGRSTVYEAFCQARSNTLMDGLYADMKVCQEDDVHLFSWLVPVLYTWFPLVTVGNSQLLRLVMGTVDSVQLMDLISLVLQGRLAVLPADSTLISLLETSLVWDTFEQMALWQLVAAHGVSLHSLLPLIPVVKYPENSEAISSLLIMLRRERPTSELVGLLLQRPVQASDTLVPSVLAYWSRQYRGALSDAVVSQLNNSLSQSKPSLNSPAKRKRAGHSGKAKEPEPPPEPKGLDKSLETMLGHLDSMRQCVLGTNGCLVYNLGLSSANQKVQENFFSLDNLQNALAQVQSLCTDPQKNRFSDLFALADTDVEAPREKRGRKAAKSKGRQAVKYDSDSSEGSSEEEVIKQRPVKKRRKAAQVGSDSD